MLIENLFVLCVCVAHSFFCVCIFLTWSYIDTSAKICISSYSSPYAVLISLFIFNAACFCLFLFIFVWSWFIICVFLFFWLCAKVLVETTFWLMCLYEIGLHFLVSYLSMIPINISWCVSLVSVWCYSNMMCVISHFETFASQSKSWIFH